MVLGAVGSVIDTAGGVVNKGKETAETGVRVGENVLSFGERLSGAPDAVFDAFGSIGDYLPWIIGAGLVIGAAGVYVQVTRK
jgi:hypothetical protein